MRALVPTSSSDFVTFGGVAFLAAIAGAPFAHSAPPKFAFESTPVHSVPGSAFAVDPALAGDFDGDGLPDVLTAGAVALNRGFGHFVISATGLGDASYAKAAGDFDHDGKLDVAVARSSGSNPSVDVYLGHGDGTFAPPSGIGSITARWMVAGDFDQDGRTDLVIRDGNFINGGRLQVFLNANGLVAQPPFAVPLGDGPMATGDVDGDGTTDLLILYNQFTNGLYWMRGLGGGALLTAQLLTHETGSQFAVGDLNGDGRSDAVVTSSGCTVLLSNGAAMTTAQSITVGGSPTRSILADLNIDQRLDLLVVNPNNFAIARLGNANGTFGGATSLPLQDMRDAIAMQLDGDGYCDLLVLTPSGGFGLLGKGNGSFTLPPTTGTINVSSAFTAPRLADFDLDGKLDLLWAGDSSSTLQFQKGGPGGTFGAPIHSSAVATARWILPLHIDTDGLLDAVTAEQFTVASAFSAHRNNGGGVFAFAGTTSIPAPLTTMPTAADVDGDGDDDVILLTATRSTPPPRIRARIPTRRRWRATAAVSRSDRSPPPTSTSMGSSTSRSRTRISSPSSATSICT